VKLRTAAFHAVRAAVTLASLGLAFLLIDLEDRMVFHLADGARVEAASWAEQGGRIAATLPEGGQREFAAAEVVRREERPGLVSVVRRSRLGPASLVVPAMLVVFLLLAARWRLLLGANGFEIPFGRAFRITWAGVFFNQVLPGTVGGDIAKGLMISRGEARKAALFGTVLLDRLVGLGTVIVIAGLATAPVMGRPELRPVVALITTLIAAGAAGAAIYFSPALRRAGWAQRLKNRLPFRKAVEEVDDVLKTMHHAPRVIVQGAGLSAAAQAVSILATFGLAWSMGIRDLSAGDFFLIQPVIFLVTAVPISIGGWGVEQFISVYLYGMAGMAPSEAVALSVLSKLATLAASLPGALLFAAGKAGGAPQYQES
jgi:hypothetical protein